MSTGSKVIISGLMFGGGQQMVVDLAIAAARLRRRVHVVLLGNTTGRFERFDPRVIDYDGRYNNLCTVFRAFRQLRVLLKEDQVPLIHTHGWDSDVIGWLACRGLKVHQIVHLHVTPGWLESRAIKHKVRRWLAKWMLASPYVRVVAVSRAVRRYWSEHLNLDPGHIVVIYNGVDVEYYRPTTGAPDLSRIPVIGVAARLTPTKGIEYMIDAAARLKSRGVRFRLDIAGSGKTREALERRVADAGLSDEVRLLGQVERMRDFYRTLDIFVLPSVSPEGLPLSVLEAMASGLPVVATSVAGPPEVVEDGASGFLVSPRDSVSLADRLGTLLGDPELRRSMGRNARERAVGTFSQERFAREMFAFYP